MRRMLLVIVTVAFLCSSRPVFAAIISPVDAPVTVSVEIGNASENPPTPGDNQFQIFGLTSPGARVVIQNPGIRSETYANETGTFRFRYLYLSQFKEDVCIVAYDTSNRSTPPLCIPPPGNDTIYEVGPVLLPPSTSISAGDAYIGDSVTLSGQTLPNVDVKLSMFTDELQQGKLLSFVPAAYAYTIPSVDLKSDAKGNYSLTLPTSGSQFLRMFSRAIYAGNSTPKGLTLVLNIFPLWMIIIKFFSTFVSTLWAHIIDIIILLQLYIILMYGLKRFLKPHFLAHQRRLLAIRNVDLLSLPHDLMKTPHNLPHLK